MKKLKTHKVLMILIFILIVLVTLSVGAYTIYAQIHKKEAVSYLVDKYGTQADDYDLKHYYPKHIVNNSSHTSNLFDFYYTTEKWLFECNGREFFVEKINKTYYDNYQLEDISEWSKTYLQQNFDENIIGIEVSTELLYNPTLPNLPTNTNRLISEDDIEELLINNNSVYKKTINVYYRVENLEYYRNSMGYGNKEYEKLKSDIEAKFNCEENNIEIYLMLFENDIACERFKKEFKKGFSCQIYGVPYNEIENQNGYF